MSIERNPAAGRGRSPPSGAIVMGMVTKPFVHGLLLLVAILNVSCGESVETPPATPMAPTKAANVLLVVVDSVRADHLSSYGYSQQTSPFLDEFARRGARFTQAYAHASHTKLSVASIMTGLTPPNHGLRYAAVKGANRSDSLSESVHTLAEIFKAADYATGSTPFSRTVELSLLLRSCVVQFFLPFVDCGTVRCSRRHLLVLRHASGIAVG